MLKEAAGIQKVVLKTGRTDLRRGIDGLKAIILLNGMDPLEKGTLYLFCGRRNVYCKIKIQKSAKQKCR